MLAGLSPALLRHRLQLLSQPSTRQEPIMLPALYLSGRHDRLVPRRAFEQTRRLLPRLTECTIDAGHFLLQARPKACAEAITQWLELCALNPQAVGL